MPGPMSAPNGDRRLTQSNLVWIESQQKWVQRREQLLRSNKLHTGKTEAKRKK